MTIDEWELMTVIETLVEQAEVDLDQEPRFQLAFDRAGLARLGSLTRTRAGQKLLRVAFQEQIELIFAQWDIDARTLRWWGITMRLRDKVFVPARRLSADGQLSPRSEATPFPLEFSADDIAWMHLHLAHLQHLYLSAAISEPDFDRRCRALFAAPPNQLAA